MTQPVQEPTTRRTDSMFGWGQRQLQRRPAMTGSCGEWQTPSLVNGWAQPEDPYEIFEFRIGSCDNLEFKGHLDAFDADPCTVAFTLPAGWTLADLGHEDQFVPTQIVEDDGAGCYFVTPAVILIAATSGDVTIIWEGAS